MNNSRNYFFYIWIFFIPIQSFLLFSQFQGTTIANIQAIFAFAYLIHSKKFAIFKILFFFVMLYLISLTFQQFTELPNLDYVILVRESMLGIFRTSFFTQSLYLFVGLTTFFYVKEFYKASWDKYIIYSGILAAFYGLYEEFYFINWGDGADFISNRMFGESMDLSGSLTQHIEVGGFPLLRLKSYMGEPSMYVLSIFPVFVFSVAKEYKISSCILLISLLFTFSSIGYLFLLLFFASKAFTERKFFILSLLFLCALIFFNLEISNEIFWDKINLKATSGSDRFNFFSNALFFFSELSQPLKLIGIGFGSTRSTDFFSTLLVNNGLIGLAIFMYFIFRPFSMCLNNKYFYYGFICTSIGLMMLLAVPEFAYLFIWVMFGISYNEFQRFNNENSHNP